MKHLFPFLSRYIYNHPKVTNWCLGPGWANEYTLYSWVSTNAMPWNEVFLNIYSANISHNHGNTNFNIQCIEILDKYIKIISNA
jgi:hypothetical protein